MDDLDLHAPWWATKGKGPAAELEIARRLKADFEGAVAHPATSYRLDMLDRLCRYSRGWGLGSMYGIEGNADGLELDEQDVSFNVIRSTRDTILAKIGKQRPRIQWLTTGGNEQEQRQAKLRTKWCDGLWANDNVYGKMVKALADALDFGDGFVYAWADVDDADVKHQWVPRHEILTHPGEDCYGAPRTIYWRRRIHRHSLAAMYPKLRGQILELQGAHAMLPGEDTDADTMQTQMVDVVHSWHLRSSKSANDGRYAVVCDRLLLEHGSWDLPVFPMVKIGASVDRSGWWSQGIAERLLPTQREIARIMTLCRDAMKQGSIPRVFASQQTEFSIEDMSDVPMTVVRWTGGPEPVVVSQNVVPSENFAHLQRLIEYAYQSEGVSELSAGAKKPGGLDAAVALREYSDIESERHVLLGQALEQAYLDLAALDVMLAKELFARGVDMVVQAPDTDTARQIKWSDVDLDEDRAVMRRYPTSSLPSTPAAKKAFVTELVQGELIDQKEARQLLDFPDLESSLDDEMAGEIDAKEHIRRIVEDGNYEPPDPDSDLALLEVEARRAYRKGRAGKLGQSRTEMLRMLLAELRAMPQPVQQEVAPPNPEQEAQAAAQAAAQVAPQGTPMAGG